VNLIWFQSQFIILPWVFPRNNDEKDIEHGKLYINIPEYQEKARNALKTKGQDKKPYPLTRFSDFPKVTKRIIGKAEYKLPNVR